MLNAHVTAPLCSMDIITQNFCYNPPYNFYVPLLIVVLCYLLAYIFFYRFFFFKSFFLLADEEGEKPGTTARLLRYPRLQEKDGDDHDYQPEEEDWRKTIMVGSEYQAMIPEGLCRYDDALPYENEDKILWDPTNLSEDAVVSFLKKVPGVGGGSNSQITRDDEQALFLLLQCGFNVEEALRRRQMNVVAATDTMSLWSDEECRNFESGLRTYGKDFHLIQQNKVRTRSVGELVQFYYLWKKTERHDVFANEVRNEKKKHTGLPLALWSVLEMEL